MNKEELDFLTTKIRKILATQSEMEENKDSETKNDSETQKNCFDIKSFGIDLKEVKNFKNAVMFSLKNNKQFDVPAIFVVKGPSNCGKTSFIESLFFSDDFCFTPYIRPNLNYEQFEMKPDEDVRMIWIQHPLIDGEIDFEKLCSRVENRVVVFEFDDDDIPEELIQNSIYVISLKQLPISTMQQKFSMLQESYGYSAVKESEVNTIINNNPQDILSNDLQKILIRNNITKKELGLIKNDIKKCFSQEEFDDYYGFLKEDINNPLSVTTYKTMNEIRKHLDHPIQYLKVYKDIKKRFIECLKNHPNIIESDKLYSWFTISTQFSSDKIISFSRPLLFVGPAGCGKTMLCKELSKIFGQANSIFIPLGVGGGVSKLMGSTPDYKNATYGDILSSIWRAQDNNTCCGNPCIILDEIDKTPFSGCVSDVNQNTYPVFIQLFGDENRNSFRDNFFGLKIDNIFINYLVTANEIEEIPEPLLDRFTIVHFRDYNESEMKEIIIPSKYKSFYESHSKVLPKELNQEDIEKIYFISGNHTRSIEDAIYAFVAYSFNEKGERINTNAIYNSINSVVKERQIGFCL